MTAVVEESDAGTGLRLLTNVPALDGVRGMAVIIVVVFHGALLMPSLRRFTYGGNLGVDAFFVLSGFLITALLLREESVSGHLRFGAFYRRRALRLLPALVVFLAAQVVYATIIHVPAASERGSVFSVLFYYSNTWLRRLAIPPGIGHLWSLAVEEQFYIVWPLVFLLFLDLRRRLSTVVTVMTGLIVAVAVHRVMLFDDGAPRLFLYTRLITRADALLVGALLAQIWVRGRVPKRGLTLAAWPALAFYLFAVVHGVSDAFLYRGGWTLVAIAVALILLAVLESPWRVNAFLRLRPLRAIGRVSYGLYIWHLLIFEAIFRYERSWSPVTRLVVGLLLSAVVCSSSWILVERPFLRWKSRLESPRSSRSLLPVGGLLAVSVALVVGAGGLIVLSGRATTSPATTTVSTFAVSSADVTVPDVVGMNAYAAVAALSNLRLNFKVTSRASSAANGDVISQDPPAGTEVRGGTFVGLIVSKGPSG